jgi:hypothetical protein
MAAPCSAFFLPDTGQTKCYQTVYPWGEIPCAGTGQDGEYSINPPSYTDNGDGTVTDDNTGLVWQKEDNGNAYNWYRATGTYDAIYNPHSRNACRSFGRLPSKKDLTSIVDYAVPYPGPTIDPVFTSAKASRYWSSTSHAGVPAAPWLDSAWQVAFDRGSVGINVKNEAGWVDGSGYNVRCVRDGLSTNPTLSDNLNGTVTDSRTGLIWQQGEPGAMDWGAALSYCEGLDLGGSTSWRLPNVKELESLTDDTRWNLAIDTSVFPDAAQWSGHTYWTSTTNAYFPDRAWTVGFISGSVGYADKVQLFRPVVRCVQGGLTSSSLSLSEALDLTRSWATGGTKPWFGQIFETHDGVDAAQSGSIAERQKSWISTSVTGPATITFWWMTSSDIGDELTVYIDGRAKGSISGQGFWQQNSISISGGSHVVKWEFARKNGGSDGLNAAFLDQVTISP